MLSYEDEPTIRNAIMKRLHDKARGWGIADIRIVLKPKECIQVRVWLILEKLATPNHIPDIWAFFDLPLEFRLRQVHNEIDEIAENAKLAERRHRHERINWQPNRPEPREILPGTGLRGRWSKDDEVSAP